jgi:hypothetical protein
MPAMNLHGDFAGSEFRRYLFIEQARNYRGHHFALACGQRPVVLSQLANFAPLLTRYPVTIPESPSTSVVVSSSFVEP